MKKVFTGILAGSALLVNTAFAQTASYDNTIALIESGDDISFTSTTVNGEETEYLIQDNIRTPIRTSKLKRMSEMNDESEVDE